VTLTVVDPATEEPLAELEQAGVEEADEAVARAKAAYPAWRAVAPADRAIRIANDTPYGLSGSIWTRDGARALRVARAIEAGVLSVNANTSVRVQTPFGGFK
jgi:acyl-CoA reductase-like NAD-dependent aldehyde dehydrogenase